MKNINIFPAVILFSLSSITLAQEPDYVNAIPMPLPEASEAPTTLSMALLDMLDESTGARGFSPGAEGSGELAPRRGKVEQLDNSDSGEIGSQEFGTFNHPFSTARVDGYGHRNSKEYPYRATGKLYFKKGSSTYVCTASLIKKGVILTAAHCVWNWGGGTTGRYNTFRYQPAKYNTSLPYGGTWIAYSPRVRPSYKYGWVNYCTASSPGVVCKDDIAVLRVKKKFLNGSWKYPGDLTGYYGYAWNGFGFTNGANGTLGSNLAQITQLGYPVSHDSGYKMQRTDSVGYKDSTAIDNTIIGSRQTGGSSGGPWLINFGSGSSLSGTGYGSEAARNRVIGVTSWGYISNGPKVQGASRFTSNNIVPLMNSVCYGGYTGC